MPPPRSNVAEFVSRLAAHPCCAAITVEERLEQALASPVPIVFVLRADGLELRPTVRRIHDAGKLVAVHLDLVDGLKADRAGVAWVAGAGADAIISSHGQLMAAIQREGSVAIHRLLLVRQSLVGTALTAIARSKADIVEVLPGAILPDVAPMIPPLGVPLLAGGFIRTSAAARAVLAAGAAGVTTSSEEVWHAALAAA